MENCDITETPTPKGKVFFASDLHFGHERVIQFDNRPFQTVEEMDAELIRRWNNKVGKGDLVYVLGDFIWKSCNGEAHNLINSLNGQIILIKGNHDRFLHNAQAKKALAGVKDYDDIVVTLDDGTKKRCILSHYFIPMYNGHRYGAIHLHGHSHFTEEAKVETDFAKWMSEQGIRNEIYNVGCMYWNYEPVTLDEILKSFGNFIDDGEVADSIREAIPEVTEQAKQGFLDEDDILESDDGRLIFKELAIQESENKRYNCVDRIGYSDKWGKNGSQKASEKKITKDYLSHRNSTLTGKTP